MNKIDATLLRDFIKKASLNGSIMSINMNFEEDGLHSSVRDFTYVALTNVFIKRESFAEYQAIGEIFIKNTLDFMKYLKSFPGNVNIVIDDTYNMTLSNDDREINVLLGSDIICDNVNRNGSPLITFEAEFDVKKTFLKKAIEDMSTIKIKSVTITKNADEVKLEVGVFGESDYFINKDETEHTAEASVKIGSHIIDLFNSLDNNCRMSVITDGPLMVVEDNEAMDFSCFIAPIIEE